MGTIWVTSDLHLNHANIIKYCDRPYSDVKEMNENILTKFNEKVSDEDTVYLLGDLVLGDNKEFKKWFSALKGKKIWIRGNHDTDARVKMGAPFCEKVVYADCLKIGKEKSVYFSHYPTLMGNGDLEQRHFPINCHGHIHSTDPWVLWNQGRCYDCGVDGNNFEPVNLEKLVETIKKKPLVKN